jgi:imidazolonepropionase-like amidohydrolase
MRTIIFVLILVTTAIGTFAQREPRFLVFTNATVINVKSGRFLREQTIVITDDRITALSPKAKIPPRALVVDATGQFVVPGFWDMHAHALWSNDQVQRMLDLFLANGVTAVRDMGSPLAVDEIMQWRKEVSDGAVLGPRLFPAGKIIDGPQPVWPGSLTAETDQQAKEAVAYLHDHGVDFIKVYSRLPRAAYFAIAAEAKKDGIDYVGHVPIYISAREASTAGQRSIEHLSEILLACSSDELALRKQLVATAVGADRDRVRKEQLKVLVNTFSEKKAIELSRTFASNNTWHVPTLLVQHTFALMNPNDLRNSPGVEYVPPTAVMGWMDRLGSFRKTRNEEDMSVQRRSYELEVQVVQTMHRAGVHFMTGTDAETFFPAGYGLHTELALLVEAGFSPLEALQAATLNPATYFHKTAESGTVEVGKTADLVFLEGNPLQDIHNTQQIAAVVTAGRYLDREKIHRLLSEAASLAGKGE